jgi:hypothetical protein
MKELGISGWELGDLPEDTQLIADIWVNNLENRDPLLSERVQQFKQQALIHQKILA